MFSFFFSNRRQEGWTVPWLIVGKTSLPSCRSVISSLFLFSLLRSWRCRSKKEHSATWCFLHVFGVLTFLNLLDVGDLSDSVQQAPGTFLILTSVDVSRCASFQDEDLEALCKRCPLIDTLDLGFCDKLSEVAIATCIKRLPNLKKLSLRGCVQLTSQWFVQVLAEHSQFVSLDLRGCDQLGDSVLEAISASCTNLQSLRLGYLPRAKFDVTTAEAIRITGEKLVTLADACHRLNHLDLDLLYASHIDPQSLLTTVQKAPLDSCSLYNLGMQKELASATVDLLVQKMGHNVTHLGFFTAYHRQDSFLHVINSEIYSPFDLEDYLNLPAKPQGSPAKTMIFGNNFARDSGEVTMAYLKALRKIPAGKIKSIYLDDFHFKSSDFRDEFVEAIRNHRLNIEHLYLGGNSGSPSWDDEVLVTTLIEMCPNLTSLNMELEVAVIEPEVVAFLFDRLSDLKLRTFNWSSLASNSGVFAMKRNREQFTESATQHLVEAVLKACPKLEEFYINSENLLNVADKLFERNVSIKVCGNDITLLDVCTHPNLVTSVYSFDEVISAGIFSEISSLYTNLTSLTVGLSPPEAVTPEDLQELLKNNPKLVVLEFKTPITAAVASVILSHGQHLQRLDFARSECWDILEQICEKFGRNFRQFQCKTSNIEFMKKVSQQCPNLEVIGDFTIVDVEVPLVIAENCPRLREIGSTVVEHRADKHTVWPVCRMCPAIYIFGDHNIDFYKGFMSPGFSWNSGSSSASSSASSFESDSA